MRGFLLGVVAIALISGPAASSEDAVSAEQVVAARKAGMALSGATVGNMKAVIDSGASVKSQGFAASALARWGRALPGLFPTGTGADTLGEDTTDARPEIWANRADFEEKAAAFAAAADTLRAAAQSDDAAAFAEAWTATRASCNACHEAYKAE